MKPKQDSAKTQEVPDDIKKLNRHVTNQLMVVYLFVAVVVVSSWGLGTLSFAFEWVFLLLAVLFMVWKVRLSALIRKKLHIEESNIHRKRALRQSETAEWLNFAVNRWWVFCSHTIEDLLKKRLDSRLEDVKPCFVDSMKLIAFTFGEQTPCIKHVRAFEYNECIAGQHKPITWINAHKPPEGLEKMSSFKIVLEADVSVCSEDFKMVYRACIGTKRIGLNMDIAVEELNISGTLQIIVQLSMDAPFPHVTKATISFIEKPEVWFNLKILKAINLSEIPLLKVWLHTQIMEGISTALVDPGKIDLHISKPGPVLSNRNVNQKKLAQGVLTVQVRGSPPPNSSKDDIRYTVLRIGEKKRQTNEVHGAEEWVDVSSFMVYDLAHDKLSIKSKCKRLLTSVTNDQKIVDLASFPFEVRRHIDTSFKFRDNSAVTLKMQYTPLPPISLDVTEKREQPELTDYSGVVYICIHGATNVMAADKGGTSDPYTILFCDRRRIMTTPYIQRTRNPRWDASVEFFVGNFSKMNLSFFVLDWDGVSVLDDDFLGSAQMSLTPENPEVIKKCLTLGVNKKNVADYSYGTITVSAVFRPVPSVAKSERFGDACEKLSPDYLYTEDLVSPASVPENFHESRHDQASRTLSTNSNSVVDEYLEGNTFVELTILEAKDLMAMDRNGFSDPYCEVLLGEKKLFRTSVKKKTLFPQWDESVILELPNDDQVLEIVMYDKDMIFKDFLGSLLVTVDKLKELSVRRNSEWFPLARAKSGQLRLRCAVINKDNTTKNMQHDIVDSTSPTSEVFENSPKIEEVNHSNNHHHLRVNDVQSSHPVKSEMPAIKVDKVDSRPIQIADTSVNSVNHWDQSSADGSIKSQNKYFGVTGRLIKAHGLTSHDGQVYCKVRLDQRPMISRTHLLSSTRLLCKSPIIRAGADPVFNQGFEVDHGAGVSMDALLVFDIKQSNRDHLATKGFSLRMLFADTTGEVHKCLALDNGIEIEIELTLGKMAPSKQPSRRFGIFKSFSFRREKEE